RTTTNLATDHTTKNATDQSARTRRSALFQKYRVNANDSTRLQILIAVPRSGTFITMSGYGAFIRITRITVIIAGCTMTVIVRGSGTTSQGQNRGYNSNTKCVTHVLLS